MWLKIYIYILNFLLMSLFLFLLSSTGGGADCEGRSQDGEKGFVAVARGRKFRKDGEVGERKRERMVGEEEAESSSCPREHAGALGGSAV